MSTLADLPTPALVLDLEVLEANLARMAERSRELAVTLRPHVKTHKCPKIGRMQRERGATGITVSTLDEASAFATAGFDDLTWAFPLVPSRLPKVMDLASRVRLGVLVDSVVAVEAIEGRRHDLLALRRRGRPLRVWMKVDCGYHRAGVDPDDPAAVELAGRLAKSELLEFAGILTHAGHAYACRGRRELLPVAGEERRVMADYAEVLRSRGIEVPEVSVGSTPTASVARNLEGVTEIRPGNYAFHDLTQVAIGSCEVTDCALTVVSSVVSSQPGAEHCVVDAGALALSKDPGPGDPRAGDREADATPAENPAAVPGPCMGRIFRELEGGGLHPRAWLTSLSQEHGRLNTPLPVGSRVRILPNHSCLAAACFDDYVVVRGRTVIDRWRLRRERS